MAAIKLSGFAGANQALNPKLLPDNVGVVSLNQKPGRGDLRSWKNPVKVATIPAGRNTIYRMGRDTNTDSQYWLSWTTVVHAVRGFDATDTTERTYFTGTAAGPRVVTNLSLDGTDPQDNPVGSLRPLGVPAPVSAPLLEVTNPAPKLLQAATETEEAIYEVQTKETRFYAYTYVTDWGWESAPSPPSAQVECAVGATVKVKGFAAAPAGGYNINRIRIYRTQTATSGTTDFYYAGELSYTTTGVFTDGSQTLGEVLPTTTWLTPPADLTYLTALWNGMLAGISGNSVRFCEAYTPYAWPVAYDVVPPDAKPVALGVFGQSLLVLTTGSPLLVSGSSPESMDQQPLEIQQGCVAPQSVVSMGSGVAWASEDGLCWYGAGGAKILTSGLMLREDWQALKPATVIGCMYEGLYFGSYDNGGGRKGFFIDPNNPQGIFFMERGYRAMYFDKLKDQLYVLGDNNEVQRWDGGTTPMSYTFKSKVFRTPRPINFAAAEVVASDYPVTFRLYVDGSTTAKHTQAVANSNPFRLPSGYMAQEWQIELTGTHAVQGVAIATSMAELAQV